MSDKKTAITGVLGPYFRILTPRSTTKKAAPLAALFGEWAPVELEQLPSLRFGRAGTSAGQ